MFCSWSSPIFTCFDLVQSPRFICSNFEHRILDQCWINVLWSSRSYQCSHILNTKTTGEDNTPLEDLSVGTTSCTLKPTIRLVENTVFYSTLRLQPIKSHSTVVVRYAWFIAQCHRWNPAAESAIGSLSARIEMPFLDTENMDKVLGKYPVQLKIYLMDGHRRLEPGVGIRGFKIGPCSD